MVSPPFPHIITDQDFLLCEKRKILLTKISPIKIYSMLEMECFSLFFWLSFLEICLIEIFAIYFLYCHFVMVITLLMQKTHPQTVFSCYLWQLGYGRHPPLCCYLVVLFSTFPYTFTAGLFARILPKLFQKKWKKKFWFNRWFLYQNVLKIYHFRYFIVSHLEGKRFFKKCLTCWTW